MKLAELSFEQLSRFGKTYYYEKDKIEQFEIQLTDFVHAGAYFYGTTIVEARHLVDRLGKIKIEIYSQEHPPAHFHITANGLKASLSIDDCSILENNGFDNKTMKNIQDWFLYSRDKLIEVWNITRPANCTVGIFKDSTSKY